MSLKRSGQSGKSFSDAKQTKLDVIPPVSWQTNGRYRSENILKPLKEAWTSRKHFENGNFPQPANMHNMGLTLIVQPGSAWVPYGLSHIRVRLSLPINGQESSAPQSTASSARVVSNVLLAPYVVVFPQM